MKLHELFFVEYPKTLVYADMIPDAAGINFVSSQGADNSVVGRVQVQKEVKIYPAGVITVPLKGTVLAAHLQAERCYVAHQVAVLSARRPMSAAEKLFYCLCIRSNAYRFSYGRQADRTLREIELPDSVPGWAGEKRIEPVFTAKTGDKERLDTGSWREYPLRELFSVRYGVNMELMNCEIAAEDDPEAVNFVARTSGNNGVAARVRRCPGIPPQPAGLITCAGGGSVLSAFVQNKEFYSGRDLYLLIPKYEMSLYAKLFCCTVIQANKYRYSYGRQANRTLPDLVLKLPAGKDKRPDFVCMDRYIRSLPYGDRLKG